MAEQLDEQKRQKRSDRWLLIMVFILFLVGISIRSFHYANATSGPPMYGSEPSERYRSNALPDASETTQRRGPGPGESDYSGNGNLLISFAPYLTEGGLSFFLGFCIGYFLRVVAKTMMFVVGGLYFCLIVLSHYGVITVDWGHFQHLLQQILFNTQTHIESLQDIIRISIPSIAMGGVGIWRGLKKG